MTMEDFYKDIETLDIGDVLKMYAPYLISTANKMLDEQNELKTNLERYPGDAPAEVSEFIRGLDGMASELEGIRGKLMSGDFNLSPLEISRCGLILCYAHESFNVDKIQLEKGMQMTAAIGKKLLGDKFEEVMENFRKF